MRTSEYDKVTNYGNGQAWSRFEGKRKQNVQGIAKLQRGLEVILEAFPNATAERHLAAVDMLEPLLREQQLQAVVLDELLEDLLHEQRAAKVELATAASAWPRARGEESKAARAVLEDCRHAVARLLSAAGGCESVEEQPRSMLNEVSPAAAFFDDATFFLRNVRLRLNKEVAAEAILGDSEGNDPAKHLEQWQRDSDDLQDLLNRANEVLSSTADSWSSLAAQAAEAAEAASVSSPTKVREDVALTPGSLRQPPAAASSALEVAVVVATASPTKVGRIASVSPPPLGSRSPSPNSMWSQTLAFQSSLAPGVGATSAGDRRPLVRMSSAPCLQRRGPSRRSSPIKRPQATMGYSVVVPAGSSYRECKQASFRSDADIRLERPRSPTKYVTLPGKPLVHVGQPAFSSTSAVVAAGGKLFPGHSVVLDNPINISHSLGAKETPGSIGGIASVCATAPLSASSRGSSATVAPISGDRPRNIAVEFPLGGPVELVVDDSGSGPTFGSDDTPTCSMACTPVLEASSSRCSSSVASAVVRDAALYRHLPPPSSQNEMGQRPTCGYPPPCAMGVLRSAAPRIVAGRQDNS